MTFTKRHWFCALVMRMCSPWSRESSGDLALWGRLRRSYLALLLQPVVKVGKAHQIFQMSNERAGRDYFNNCWLNLSRIFVTVHCWNSASNVPTPFIDDLKHYTFYFYSVFRLFHFARITLKILYLKASTERTELKWNERNRVFPQFIYAVIGPKQIVYKATWWLHEPDLSLVCRDTVSLIVEVYL